MSLLSLLRLSPPRDNQSFPLRSACSLIFLPTHCWRGSTASLRCSSPRLSSVSARDAVTCYLSYIGDTLLCHFPGNDSRLPVRVIQIAFVVHRDTFPTAPRRISLPTSWPPNKGEPLKPLSGETPPSASDVSKVHPAIVDTTARTLSASFTVVLAKIRRNWEPICASSRSTRRSTRLSPAGKSPRAQRRRLQAQELRQHRGKHPP